jgi:tetratricopeptide (TPR) repeat protein
VGWFWYLITLLPVIGLVKLGMQAMADRYTYIPFVGLYIAFTWCIHDMVGNGRYVKRTIIISAGASLMALMLCTARQVPHWKDSVSLFQHAVEATRGNYMAHKFLGNALAEEGRHKEAMGHLKTALRLYPDFAGAHNDLAVVLVAQGRHGEAVSHLHEVLRIEPSYGRAHYNLAYTLAQQQRITEAVYHYSEAIRLDPQDAKAHINLGLLLEGEGKLDQAIEHYSEAMGIDPLDAIARNNLKRALEKAQHLEQKLK